MKQLGCNHIKMNEIGIGESGGVNEKVTDSCRTIGRKTGPSIALIV